MIFKDTNKPFTETKLQEKEITDFSKESGMGQRCIKSIFMAFEIHEGIEKEFVKIKRVDTLNHFGDSRTYKVFNYIGKSELSDNKYGDYYIIET